MGISVQQGQSSVWEDENVLEMDDGESHMTLSALHTRNVHLRVKMLNVMYILPETEQYKNPPSPTLARGLHCKRLALLRGRAAFGKRPGSFL